MWKGVDKDKNTELRFPGKLDQAEVRKPEFEREIGRGNYYTLEQKVANEGWVHQADIPTDDVYNVEEGGGDLNW